MSFTGKKLKNPMKRNKFMAWLMFGVMLAAMLSLSVPAYADGGEGVAMLAAGNDFSLILKEDGTVWAWGGNSCGQLGDGTLTDRRLPVPVQGLEGKTITAIAAGGYNSVALDSTGKVWVWGDNAFLQLGISLAVMNKSSVPVEISDLGNKTIVAIAAGYAHIVALADDGTMWAWGSNEYDQLGLGNVGGPDISVMVPAQVLLDNLGGRTVTAIFAGYNNTAVIADDGTLWDCGYNGFGILGRPENVVSKGFLGQITGFGAAAIEGVAMGQGFMAARDSDGAVWSWGANFVGESGDSVIGSRNAPGLVQALTDQNIIAISAGVQNTAALDDTETVWTCGENEYGQLGNGETTASDTVNYIPAASTLTGFSKISVGKSSNHMLGLKNDGTLWAWGRNSKGQLGDGTTTNSNVPVRVAGMATLSAAGALVEDGLDGTQLTANVSLDSFKNDLAPGQFTLNNAPEGLTVTDAVYSGGASVLTLGFDGDFDTDINNFSVTISASALNGGRSLTTGNLEIAAIDEPHVTPDQALNEKNLDGRTLTVDLQTGTFADSTLDPDSFALNNAPPGMCISGVNYNGATQCDVILASDGSDFDSDITHCSITIDGAELNDGNPQTTDKFTITAVQESASAAANQSLAENSLNGSLLSVILVNDTFRDSALDKSNFILNNAPAGLSVKSIFYNDATHCVVTLSYDGTYFSDDINDFNLTIKAAEVSSKGDVSTNSLMITAQPQALSISTDSLPAATVEIAYSEAVQATGGTGAYTWSATGLFSGLNLNPVTGEIYGTPDISGSEPVTFTVEDEDGNSMSKTLTLQVNLAVGTGKYTITPVADGSYVKGTTVDGIVTMTVNSGVTGFKYFSVSVAPAETHYGDEVVAFVQLRNGTQLSINATSTDFDIVAKARAGFNVQAGDIIKVYIVDDLTNDENFNPTLLQ